MFKKVPLQGSDRIKIAIALGLLLGLVAIQPATAESIGSNPTGLYVGAARGLDFYKDDDDFDFEGGASLSLQLGYRFSDNWRAELDSSVTAVGLDDTGDDDDILGIVRGTLSLYYDFQSSDNLLVPYAGAGLGIAGVDDDIEWQSEFTWHGEAGLSLNITPNFAIVPAYRYSWIDDSRNVTADNLEGHSLKLGARVSF